MPPMKRREAVRHILTAVAAPLLASCRADRLFHPQFSTIETGPITLIGAGDLHAGARAASEASRLRTAALVQSVLEAAPTATAFANGDLTQNGLETELQLLSTSWTRFRERTYHGFGNHDVPMAAAFYTYAGTPPYYAVNLGDCWRLYVLNCETLDRGGANQTEQLAWLRADLAANSATRHILAMSHYPLFASVCAHLGRAMIWPARLKPWWQALQEHGAEFLIAGHVHRWERYKPKLADGTVSPSGLREFIVGTAGAGTYTILAPAHPDCERLAVEKGVGRFDLYPDRYEWKFINEWGVLRDSGVQLCRKVLVV